MKFRNSPSHGAGGYNGLRPRNIKFKKVVTEVMRDRSNNRFMDQMEKMLRRIVREEFDRLIQPHLSSWSAPVEGSRSETQASRVGLKLRFIKSPPPSLFTGSKIRGKDGSPVAIELVNAATNARVVSGAYASARVEMVPLNADFAEESWSADAFGRHILKQREGKRPLLTGELTVTLQNGVGVIADVAFSDNSSWTRSGKFRLGARLTGGGAVEARSEAFGCKDQRGESYRKHHPPYPADEVWRLEKIAKGGVSAKRLHEHGIQTVKDFRRSLAMERDALYSILTGAPGGISKRLWETIVSHAMDCVLDQTDCYVYDATAQDVSLLFNSVYELIKVSSNGGPFQNTDQFNSCILEQLKLQAYQNRNCFQQVDPRTFENHPQRSLHCPQDQGFGIACPRLQHIDFQGSSGPSDTSMSCFFTATTAPGVQPEMLMNFENLPAATFHIDGKFLSSLRNSFRVNEPDPIHDEAQTSGTRGWEEKEQVENTISHLDAHPNWSPGTAHWAHEMMESMLVSVSCPEEARMYDVRIADINVGSPRARWCKVKAAFKLREVWRHTTARNRGRGKACLPY